MKSSAIACPHAPASGVWPALVTTAKVACGNCAAAMRPCSIGVLLSRSPDCTSTGTSGSGRPCSDDPAVGSAGQSTHCGPASIPVLSHAAGDNGRNCARSSAASADRYWARRSAGGAARSYGRG